MRAWQFGQMSRRFSSVLFEESPSMWSTSKATRPLNGLTSDHPHSQHSLSNFLKMKLRTTVFSLPPALVPLSSPDFQASKIFEDLSAFWQALSQYLLCRLFLVAGISSPQ